MIELLAAVLAMAICRLAVTLADQHTAHYRALRAGRRPGDEQGLQGERTRVVGRQ